MAIIHVNPYEGFTRQRLMSGSQGYGYYPMDPNYSSARGYVLPVWDQALQPYPTSFNHLNYDLMHARSIPSYKDVVGAGATTDYRRVRAYLSPTGSPYIYDSGDIDGEMKPFKYYFSWNQGDYGHYSNIKTIGGTSTNRSGRSNMFSQGRTYDGAFGLGKANTSPSQFGEPTSPHWMLGYSLVNSGELTFLSMPHAFSDSGGPGYGSTTTKTPQGFGGIRAMKVWSPYLHMDPDKHNEMVKAVGYHTTALTTGNINVHLPWDGSYQTEIIENIGLSAELSIFGPHYGFGGRYDSFGYDTSGFVSSYMDTATAGSASTTTEFTGIGSTAWSVGYNFPPASAATNTLRWADDPSGNAGSQLGYCIDYSDGFLIAGAPGYDGNNGLITSRKDRGGIVVYTVKPEGQVTSTYNHTDNAFYAYSRREGEQPGDRFGQAVAVGHNRFIVGAPGFNGGKGKAYLYTDAWRDHEAGPEHETNPDNDPTLHFLTTNYSRPNTSTRSGLSNISQSTGGSYCKHGHRLYGLKLIKEITPATGVGASFGYAVSIGNGRIAISNLEGAGSVEVFNLEGNRIGILTAPDGQPGDCFGRSVDIEQGVIAVGAPHAVVGIATTTSSYAKQNVRCGAVYLFDRNRVSSVHQRWRGGHHDPQGNEITPCFLWKQHPPDGANGDRFGDSICVGSGRVLVGAPFKSHFDTPSADGSAYCYNLHGGLLNNITAASYKERPQNINSYAGWGNRGPGIRTDSHFGHAVSINGHTAVISAPFHAEYIEYAYMPDSIFFYYTPQCLTVWDAIDSYNGRI